MANRNVVRVLPQNGNRKITYNTVEKKICNLKSDAISFWTNLAKNNHMLSQLVVHKADWKIGYEYTYWSDPYPPKG